jgi:hypothetical protein
LYSREPISGDTRRVIRDIGASPDETTRHRR